LDTLDDCASDDELSTSAKSLDDRIHDEDEVNTASLMEDGRLAYSASVALSSVHATIKNNMQRKQQSTIFFIQPPL
jgi:hypothetical protein